MHQEPSSRREFLKSAAFGAAAGAAAISPGFLRASGADDKPSAAAAAPPFALKYAPAVDMFTASAGKDPIDNIKFIAGQGFRAVFDNGLPERPATEQEAMAREAARLGLEFGPFVSYAEFKTESFVLNNKDVRDLLDARLKIAMETSRRTGIRKTLMVPGRYDLSMDWGYQTANAIENLKRLAGACEPAGLTIVLEPLNPKNHPGVFLSRMSQAYEICRAVGSPSIKILDDIYHQQITEGNLIPNIDACWDELAAFHLGDSPGRNEPGTGEINFKGIFRHLKAKGWQGVLCMEHGKSRPGREGDQAVIKAYREADPA